MRPAEANGDAWSVEEPETASDRALADLLARQRAAFRRDGPPACEARRAALARLLAAVRARQEDLAAAVSADFGHRSPHETRMAEIYTTVSAAKHARRHLRGWMRPRRVPVALDFRPARARVLYQPLGVVGVVAPWNYPVLLALGPIVGALAAGNRVMLKPSEFTPRTAELLTELLAAVFEPDEVAVVTGGADIGAAFSRLPFDHLLFTGSTSVGRKVMAAAAANLTPVTLELGGKSPVILDRGYPMATAVRRIVAGKMLNAGQTCIAPDYVLVPEESVEAFTRAAGETMARMYPTMTGNPDYTSIIDQRHCERLDALIADARARGARVVEIGPADETADTARRKLPLTLVLDPPDDALVMQDEIFGPVLPVLAYRDLDEAIARVNDRPRPLALYFFGRDRARRDRVLQQTVSGGVTVNDTLLHAAIEELPFGGVGASGMGAYHGFHGFRTFSHEKGVLYQSRLNATGLLMHPPFGRLADFLVRALIRR